MTLNDLWARFKVIYSLNAEKRKKMVKYSNDSNYFCSRVAGGIISISPTYSCAVHLLTYLLTFTE